MDVIEVRTQIPRITELIRLNFLCQKFGIIREGPKFIETEIPANSQDRMPKTGYVSCATSKCPTNIQPAVSSLETSTTLELSNSLLQIF
jgi:hypothetical protein